MTAPSSHTQILKHLEGRGLDVRTGPFVFRIQSHLADVAEGLALHYRHHPCQPASEGFADFHVQVRGPKSIRRWIRPQVLFYIDGESPFLPMPGHQGYPMLEWGLNWCITGLCHQYLTIHAGVLERNGRVLILPAPPGSGKSTLTAALSMRGWRLLSDELALIDMDSGLVVPMPRPVSLKNESIEVIRAFEPKAVMNTPVPGTNKGTVAHLSASADSVNRYPERALPGWMILPKFEKHAPTRLEPLSKPRAFMELANNSFNHNIHGERGFARLTKIIEQSACYRFTYSRLDEAVTLFERLSQGAIGLQAGEAPEPLQP